MLHEGKFIKRKDSEELNRVVRKEQRPKPTLKSEKGALIRIWNKVLGIFTYSTRSHEKQD